MKEEYIRQVRKHLSLPRKRKQEVLRDLEEIFDSGAEHGETEQQVAERLGPPEEYAAGVRGPLEKRNNGRLLVGVILAGIFTVLRPVMRMILSVLNFCTLGLLYIAADAWLVWTAAGLVEDSVVFENYWWALAVALIINVARTLVDAAAGDLRR